MAQQQTQIPGTERDTDAELDRLAEEYRAQVIKRVDEQKKERAKKVELIALVKQPIAEGKVPAPDEGEIETVYRYADDDGKMRRIRFGNTDVVKVGVDSEDDDE